MAVVSVARRQRLLGWAFVMVGLAIGGLGLLALLLAGLALLVVPPIGAPVVAGAVRLIRDFAQASRWLAGSTLDDGERVGFGATPFAVAGLRRLLLTRRPDDRLPSPYPPRSEVAGWRRALVLVRQPMTGHDVVWLAVNGTLGVCPPVVVAALFVGSSACFGLPLPYRPAWVVAGLAGLALWWWLTPPLVEVSMRLSRVLLGAAATDALTRALRPLIAPPPDPAAGRSVDPARLGILTRREREVLALVAEGRTNAAIAARLFITEKAVDKHINNVFRKLGLVVSAEDNRRVLAALAYRDGE
ncbi:hypothetical protein Aau02nite_22680 [Amorphoplanes auranticolor]|uniref:HTH luxR-type domain-containing protein n=1 Tax=Actinoplanes auranticolor TaxID=47988 RepID=A0A919S9Q3_9ACTN|nr:hypothetical protein Aau02nite_22680 [Actinoplanes auranticolor]